MRSVVAATGLIVVVGCSRGRPEAPLATLPAPACTASTAVDADGGTVRLQVGGVDLGAEVVTEGRGSEVRAVTWPHGPRAVLVAWTAPGHYGAYDGSSTLWAVDCDAPAAGSVFLTLDGADFGNAAMTSDGRTLYFGGDAAMALDLATKQTRVVTTPPPASDCWIEDAAQRDTVLALDEGADTLTISRGGPCGFEGDYEGVDLVVEHPAAPTAVRPTRPVHAVAVDRDGAWIASDDGGLWRSLDHERWTRLPLPDDAVAHAVLADPKRSGHYVVVSATIGGSETEDAPVTGGWVYTTTDGAHWTRMRFPADLWIEPAEDGEGAESSDHHMPFQVHVALRGSTDHLLLWGPKRPPDGNDATDDDATALATWETTDGGATWRAVARIEPELPAPLVKAGAVAIETSNDGVVVTEPGRRARRVYPR